MPCSLLLGVFNQTILEAYKGEIQVKSKTSAFYDD